MFPTGHGSESILFVKTASMSRKVSVVSYEASLIAAMVFLETYENVEEYFRG